MVANILRWFVGFIGIITAIIGGVMVWRAEEPNIEGALLVSKEKYLESDPVYKKKYQHYKSQLRNGNVLMIIGASIEAFGIILILF